MFVPCFAALGIYQLGCAFENPRAVIGTAVLHFLGFGFVLFGLVVNIIESGLDRAGLLVPILGSISLWLLLSGLVDVKWYRKIKGKEDFKSASYKKVLVGLIVLYVLAFAGGGVSGFIYGQRPDEIGEHVKSVEWLPAEANDICYYKSYFFTAYEFNISEEGFLRWANKRDFDVSEISNGERFVARYISGRDYRKVNEEQVRQTSAKISNGYYYEYRMSNGGGVVAAYDKDTGRAYFESMPR